MQEKKTRKLLSRRQFLLMSGAACGLLLGGAGYAGVMEPYHPVISRREIKVPGLPDDFTGLSCLHLTDLHHGELIGLDYISRCIEIAEALKPDICFLTGDYVTGNARYIGPCLEQLARIECKYGIYAVPGNHDYWTDIKLLSGACARFNIGFLANKHVRLSVKGSSLVIVGLDDLWAGTPSLEEATRNMEGREKKILLTHNPDIFEELEPGRFDVILAGHTHGGQVSLPFLGPPIIPSQYGTKYASGLFRGKKGTMYVNRGIGMVSPAIRFNCPPEIALLTLVRE